MNVSIHQSHLGRGRAIAADFQTNLALPQVCFCAAPRSFERLGRGVELAGCCRVLVPARGRRNAVRQRPPRPDAPASRRKRRRLLRRCCWVGALPLGRHRRSGRLLFALVSDFYQEETNY